MRRAIVAVIALLLILVRTAAAAVEPLRLQDVLAAAETVATDGPRRDAILAASALQPYAYWSHLRLELLAPADAVRINAMARFFDALLRDLAYAALDEKMSVAYGTFQRIAAPEPATSAPRQAAEPLAKLEAEVRYLDLLARRNSMRSEQRLARSMLAQSMGQPDRLAAELSEPNLNPGNDALADIGVLQKSLRSAIQARRTTQAPQQVVNHSLAATQLDAEQELLRAYLTVETLRGAQRNLVNKRTELADRRFDAERDRFERNQTSDFNNAMTATVDAKHEQRIWLYQLTLAQARLGALVGQTLGVAETSR